MQKYCNISAHVHMHEHNKCTNTAQILHKYPMLHMPPDLHMNTVQILKYAASSGFEIVQLYSAYIAALYCDKNLSLGDNAEKTGVIALLHAGHQIIEFHATLLIPEKCLSVVQRHSRPNEQRYFL